MMSIMTKSMMEPLSTLARQHSIKVGLELPLMIMEMAPQQSKKLKQSDLELQMTTQHPQNLVSMKTPIYLSQNNLKPREKESSLTKSRTKGPEREFRRRNAVKEVRSKRKNS